MAQVELTLRKDRKVIKTVKVDFDKVIDRLIVLTEAAYEPIKARHAITAGLPYKYKDNGYNVTITPLVGEVY